MANPKDNIGQEQQDFVEELYNKANDDLKPLYEATNDNLKDFLKEIASILLTYSIVKDVMAMGKGEQTKEYMKMSNIIKKIVKGQATQQELLINSILKNTTKDTFRFYNYNPDKKVVQELIDQNYKGKHFSERVWDNEKAVGEHLHYQTNEFLKGNTSVNAIKKDIETTFNTSKYNASRLVETEVSRCSNSAFDRFCIETGVEKLQYKATFEKTCDICMADHDRIFTYKNKIAIPRHPKCRCYYEIADDNEEVSKIANDKAVVKTKTNNQEEKTKKEPQDKKSEKPKTETTTKKDNFKTPSNINKNPKLNQKEKDALEYYTSDGFYKTNEKLRNGLALDATDSNYIKNISSALDKLPNHEGTVYRSVKFDSDKKLNDFISDFKENKDIKFKEFISSTTDKTAFGNKYIGKTDAQLVINSASGKDISKYSMHKSESEILFDKNSKFKVERIGKNQFGGTLVWLAEI